MKQWMRFSGLYNSDVPQCYSPMANLWRFRRDALLAMGDGTRDKHKAQDVAVLHGTQPANAKPVGITSPVYFDKAATDAAGAVAPGKQASKTADTVSRNHQDGASVAAGNLRRPHTSPQAGSQPAVHPDPASATTRTKSPPAGATAATGAAAKPAGKTAETAAVAPPAAHAAAHNPGQKTSARCHLPVHHDIVVVKPKCSIAASCNSLGCSCMQIWFVSRLWYVSRSAAAFCAYET